MSESLTTSTVPIRIFNNNSLAVFASVGIHALILGVALPTLTSASQENPPTERRDVGLIELNSVEQTRLPNFDQPLPDVSEFANTPLTDIPPIDTSSLQTSLPPLNNLAASPSLPPLLSGNELSIAPPPPQRLPAAPPLAALPAPPPLSFQPQTVPSPEANVPKEPSRPDFDPPRQNLSLDDLLKAPQRYPQNNSSDIAINSQPSVPSTPDRSTTDLQEQRIQRLLAEGVQRMDSLKEDSTNTSNDEALRNDVRWRSKTQIAEPEKQTLAGIYPKDACFRKLEGSSVYGVTVNAGGQVTQLQQIKSAGYPIFNQQAEQQLRGKSFGNSSGQSKAYLVTVQFNYSPSNCPSVTLSRSNTTNSPENSQSNPAPAPEANQPPNPAPAPSAADKPAPSPAPEANQPPNPAPAPSAADKPAPSPSTSQQPAPEPSPSVQSRKPESVTPLAPATPKKSAE